MTPHLKLFPRLEELKLKETQNVWNQRPTASLPFVECSAGAVRRTWIVATQRTGATHLDD